MSENLDSTTMENQAEILKKKNSNQEQIFNLIFNRTKDIKEEIRVKSYRLISSLYIFEQFTRPQVISILESGLSDLTKSEKVKKSFGDLVCKWIGDLSSPAEHSSSSSSTSSPNGLYRFLEFIDLKTNHELVEKVLLFIFDQASLEEFSLRDVKELTMEQSFHCKLTCKYLKSQNSTTADDTLDSLLPTLTEFRDILLSHVTKPTTETTFILRQLLQILHFYDLSDEVGRSNITVVLRELIKDVPDELINDTLMCMSLLHPIEREFILLIVEFISDLIDPLEVDDSNHKKLEVLEKNFKLLEKKLPTEAAKIQSAIATIKKSIEESDTKILKKCSQICHFLLIRARRCSNSPEIDGLLQLVILPSIQHPLPEIRSLGIQNLGIFCLHRRTVALSYLNLFETIIQNDIDSVKTVCLKVIFDILLVFGSPNQIPTETLGLYKMIRSFARSVRDLETKKICIEGFVKLLYSGIICDTKILRFLGLELFATAAAKDKDLKKCLTTFFQAYPVDTLENKSMVLDASTGILQSIIQAENQNSSYSAINIVEVAKFLLSLFERPIKKSTGPPRISVIEQTHLEKLISEAHPKIAEFICKELLSCFRGKTQELIKILPLLVLDREQHQSYLERIYDILQNLLAHYTHPLLEKFNQYIISLLPPDFFDSYLQQPSISSNDPKKMETTKSSTASNQEVSGKSIKVPDQSQPIQISSLTTNTNKKNRDKNSPLFKTYFTSQKKYFDTVDDLDVDDTPFKPRKKAKVELKDRYSEYEEDRKSKISDDIFSRLLKRDNEIKTQKENSLAQKQPSTLTSLEQQQQQKPTTFISTGYKQILELKPNVDSTTTTTTTSTTTTSTKSSITSTPINKLIIKPIENKQPTSKSILKKKVSIPKLDDENINEENITSKLKKVRFTSQKNQTTIFDPEKI
eukprot:gene6123-7629_t